MKYSALQFLMKKKKKKRKNKKEKVRKPATNTTQKQN